MKKVKKVKVIIFNGKHGPTIYINANCEIQRVDDKYWMSDIYQKAMKETLKYQRIN